MKPDELHHFAHPQHPLRLVPSDLPFKCDGCRQFGIGSRLNCSLCDFDLHSHCSSPTSTTALRHPFYPQCLFNFLPRPPDNSPRYCNACHRHISGFLYHCRSCGFDLHPCCANLPHLLLAAGDLRLLLRRRSAAACHRCGRKGRSWSYRSECGKYELHVACVMEMVVESWGCGGEGKRVRVSEIRVSGIGNHGKGKGKVKRCCEVAAMAVQFVISAVLGDPTAAIAGVVSSFLF